MPRFLVQILAILIAAAAIAAVVFYPAEDGSSSSNSSDANAARAEIVNDGRPRADVTPCNLPVGNRVGQKAPYFELKDQHGTVHRLSDHLGQVVVLDFWATWCGPCRRVMPKLQTIHEQYHDRGVNMIGISCREKPGGDPAKFMADNNYTYGLLLNGEKITQGYGVTAFPTVMVIGVDGEILFSHRGTAGPWEEELRQVIDAELAAHNM